MMNRRLLNLMPALLEGWRCVLPCITGPSKAVPSSHLHIYQMAMDGLHFLDESDRYASPSAFFPIAGPYVLWGIPPIRLARRLPGGDRRALRGAPISRFLLPPALPGHAARAGDEDAQAARGTSAAGGQRVVIPAGYAPAGSRPRQMWRNAASGVDGGSCWSAGSPTA